MSLYELVIVEQAVSCDLTGRLIVDWLIKALSETEFLRNTEFITRLVEWSEKASGN